MLASRMYSLSLYSIARTLSDTHSSYSPRCCNTQGEKLIVHDHYASDKAAVLFVPGISNAFAPTKVSTDKMAELLG